MLAHGEIVVRAPYNNIPAAARAVPERIGEMSRFALEVSEDAITALTFQRSDGRLKTPGIVDHCWNPLVIGFICSAALPRQLGIIRRAPGRRRAARQPSPLERAG